MNDYCILVQKNRIAAHRIIGGSIEPIHFGGETWLKSDNFWPHFKRKIEYCNGENLAILILTDNELFNIDESIEIADAFSCTKTELIDIINKFNLSSHNVLTYPDAAINQPPIVKKQDTPVAIDSVVINQNSLQSFFMRKTQEYNRGQ